MANRYRLSLHPDSYQQFPFKALEKDYEDYGGSHEYQTASDRHPTTEEEDEEYEERVKRTRTMPGNKSNLKYLFPKRQKLKRNQVGNSVPEHHRTIDKSTISGKKPRKYPTNRRRNGTSSSRTTDEKAKWENTGNFLVLLQFFQ